MLDFIKILEYSGQYGGPSNIDEYCSNFKVRWFGYIKTKSFKIKINNNSNYFNEIIFDCKIKFYNPQDEFLFRLEFSEFII